MSKEMFNFFDFLFDGGIFIIIILTGYFLGVSQSFLWLGMAIWVFIGVKLDVINRRRNVVSVDFVKKGE